MSLLADWQIVEYVRKHRMIEPFEPGQVRQAPDGRKLEIGRAHV